MAKVLILTDGKAGHENQSKALARALGCEYEIVEVAFRSKFAKVLSYLFDRVGIRTQALWKFVPKVFASTEPLPPLPEPFRPSAVLGTGSGTFYAAKSLAKACKAKCGVVLYPRGYDLASFDCVLAPAFDRPKAAANVIEIPANLVAADEDFYAKGVAAFRERHEQKGEAVAVIVGGPNKCSTMTADWMRDELTKLFADTPDCEHWVTTSRRTPAEVEAVVDTFPFDYKLLYSKDHFNPIPAFVSLAKVLYVTAESTGMLSEACTFGTAEVRVLDNLNPGPHKFRRFAESCAALGAKKINLAEAFDAARKLLAL